MGASKQSAEIGSPLRRMSLPQNEEIIQQAVIHRVRWYFVVQSGDLYLTTRRLIWMPSMVSLFDRKAIEKDEVVDAKVCSGYWRTGEFEVRCHDGSDFFLCGWRVPTKISRSRAEKWVEAIKQWANI
jgi:hypothetical protein